LLVAAEHEVHSWHSPTAESREGLDVVNVAARKSACKCFIPFSKQIRTWKIFPVLPPKIPLNCNHEFCGMKSEHKKKKSLSGQVAILHRFASNGQLWSYQTSNASFY
jgi:hypothetical protein